MLRVATYVALMTDRDPPFPFDMAVRIFPSCPVWQRPRYVSVVMDSAFAWRWEMDRSAIARIDVQAPST